jgi:hypothetical protein
MAIINNVHVMKAFAARSRWVLHVAEPIENASCHQFSEFLVTNTPISGALQTDLASGLSYRLSHSASTTPWRLLLVLHGVGSNEAAMYTLAEGVRADTLVVLVRGPLLLGLQQFAWFQVSFTPTGPRIMPEQAEHSRQALIRLLAELQHAHGIACGPDSDCGLQSRRDHECQCGSDFA